jgi:hypothetical protein
MYLNEKKKANETEQAQRATQIEAAKARVEDLKKAVAVRKARKKEIDDQLEKFKSVSDSIQAFFQAQEEHKANMAERQGKREEMLASFQQLKQQLVTTMEQKNASIDRLARAKKAKEASNELKATNDHLEQAVIVPGKDEMKRLAEAKEALAVKITELHKSAEDHRAKEKYALGAAEERKKSLKAQVEQLVKELQTKEEENAALERMQEDFKKKNLELIASHEAQERIYQESFRSIEKEVKLRYEKYREKKENELRGFVSRSEQECSEKEKLKEFLETGIKMIQSANEAEKVGRSAKE